MKMLITPEEVLNIVLGTSSTLRAEDVPEYTILAAQRRYLRPVLGEKFYEQLVAENPSEELQKFANGYLKTPLALYVVAILLPTIASQVGATGVVRLSGEKFDAVDSHTLRRLVRRLRSDADALLDGATSHLNDNAALFPDYDPSLNIRERISLKGGVVL